MLANQTSTVAEQINSHLEVLGINLVLLRSVKSTVSAQTCQICDSAKDTGLSYKVATLQATEIQTELQTSSRDWLQKITLLQF